MKRLAAHAHRCRATGRRCTSGSPVTGCCPRTAVRGTLERDGLIVRERIESDRRQVLVRLTAEGTERLKSGIDAQVSRDQKWFAVLSEEEQHVFGEMLQRLADQVFPDREEAASD
jgi:hypothetical protein